LSRKLVVLSGRYDLTMKVDSYRQPIDVSAEAQHLLSRLPVRLAVRLMRTRRTRT
jgi:hypothetical protein